MDFTGKERTEDRPLTGEENPDRIYSGKEPLRGIVKN